MASKTVTKLSPGNYRETVRNNDGSGKSTTYGQGAIFRDVKSVPSGMAKDESARLLSVH
jgi:hypothetical protein